MSDFVITTFRMTNPRGYLIPELSVEYHEAEGGNPTGISWFIRAGGTRSYFVRFGDSLHPSSAEQAPDSHFMVRRLMASLLLGGCGLFDASLTSRFYMSGVEGHVAWGTQHDLLDGAGRFEQDRVDDVLGWFAAICENLFLRRAAEDAHTASANQHEALVYVYRGLEWLKNGQDLSWDQIATDADVEPAELIAVKAVANNEGVRHATRSGKRMRTEVSNYGTWICALLDAVNAARHRLDPEFKIMTPEQVSAAVLRAVRYEAYD